MDHTKATHQVPRSLARANALAKSLRAAFKDGGKPTLAQAQQALARGYGRDSWHDLSRHLASGSALAGWDPERAIKALAHLDARGPVFGFSGTLAKLGSREAMPDLATFLRDNGAFLAGPGSVSGADIRAWSDDYDRRRAERAAAYPQEPLPGFDDAAGPAVRIEIKESGTGFAFSMARVDANTMRALLDDPDAIVEPMARLRLKVYYPLARAVVFEGHSPGGWTRSALARFIADTYRRIYAEEEDTMPEPPSHLSDRVGLFNRPRTSGKYGISMHDLAGLMLWGAERVAPGHWEPLVDS